MNPQNLNGNKMNDQNMELNPAVEVVSSEHNESVASVVSKTPERTKEEIIAELKNVLTLPVNEIKDIVNYLKQSFYQIYNAEQAARRKQLEELADSDNDTNEEIPVDELAKAQEAEFKELLKEYKQRKAQYNVELEQEKEQNLLKKQQLIEQMQALLDTNTDVSGCMQEFKQLQQAWKEIGQVPVAASNDLWKKYNLLQENFYDLFKMNQELREYDFKKNLEAKTQLCESAEKLAEQSDVVAAFRDLQRMHDEWKAIGPVSHELREAIWARFQAVSIVVNKKHQDFFTNLHLQEKENLTKKQQICDTIAAIDLSALDTFKLWEDKNQEVIELQNQWRLIGFAPRKENQQVYENYRSLCDNFYTAKAAFYKKIKSDLADNLTKKRELCEKAEELKDSTTWKETTDKFIRLQKEWKEIGSVPKKYSDEIWKRFIAACDYFFEQKKLNSSEQHSTEKQNLLAKLAIIEKLENFEKKETSDETVAALKQISDEFNAVGFVPFKEKDKIYKRFKNALNKQYDTVNIDLKHRKLDRFRTNLIDMETQGETKLLTERRKLLRVYEGIKSEIATSENNLGFFSVKSKSSQGLLADMEQKINAQRKELLLVEEKINLIDEKLNA